MTIRNDSPLRTLLPSHSVRFDSSRRWGFYASRDSSVDGRQGIAAGRRAGAIVTCVLLALMGCSSDKTSAPAPTTDGPIDSAETTSVTINSEVPSTTSVITSTSDTTAASPTTNLTTTTTDPARVAEQAVRSAVDAAIGDFSSCLVAMPNCDPTSLGDTRADPLLSVNVARINEWNGEGYTVIDRDQFRFVVETVDLAPDLKSAVATVCFADGSKLVKPAAGPNGADLIIDGTFVSGRESWSMRSGDDGAWRVYEAPVVGTTEVTDQCAAA